MQDPDPRVEGKGHARLRDAGLDVTTDVLHDDGQRVNRAYIKWKRTARPLVTLKMALTLDGKAATRRGESRWISGESARIEGHRLRNTHDAIVVGVGTVLADDPMLTTRLPEGEPSRDPLRVVLDTLARTPLSAKVLHVPSPAQTVIACGEDADEDRVRRLEDHGAEVWKLPSAAGGVDIGALLARLGTRDVLSVLVEGGPTVHWSFVREAAADRVVAFVAPLVLGGTAVSGVGGVGFGRLAQAMRLSDWSVRRIGHDLCLEGDVAGGG
jgi:diaminohydroxyphosphoribosylaminopyrimidine deaminase/5-amino-6-(5-phosphoribosylamino)uracil reductase